MVSLVMSRGRVQAWKAGAHPKDTAITEEG